MPTSDHYNSLDDFLISTLATVDGQVTVGPGLTYPIKGRQIEATILFADISGYSARTLEMNPVETLAFVNHFFAWVTGMALQGTRGIVDKYIGDEMMIVFSKEFGSEDPFAEAVRVARFMGEDDFFAFVPHIGIASGPVIVGYAGTPLMYNCSVFGAPVALAARCAGIKPDVPELSENGFPLFSCVITFPEANRVGRDFEDFFAPRKYIDMERNTREMARMWDMLPARSFEPKNIPELEIRQVIDRGFYITDSSPEDSARQIVKDLRAANRYWPELT